MIDWHILTGEYPPQTGGVGDYTALVARALAAEGDRVNVWAPPADGADVPTDPHVLVRRLPDHYGRRSLRALDQALDAVPGPRRLLVQYVPHAFGLKGANLPFCVWLYSRRQDSVWIMFHEVAHPVSAGHRLTENLLGVVTRGMAALAGRAAERIFVSIPAWRSTVESIVGSRTSIEWLPVPSSIPDFQDVDGALAIRRRLAGDRPLVGHLGTYGHLIGSMLADWLSAFLALTNCHILLLGRGAGAFRFRIAERFPQHADRLTAPGWLEAHVLSRHVGACDAMLQPYPDGASSRRTSLMVGLAHAKPVVTTLGRLTEPLWSNCGAVLFGRTDDAASTAELTAALLADPTRLSALSSQARSLYAERFDLRHTIDRLRSRERLNNASLRLTAAVARSTGR